MKTEDIKKMSLEEEAKYYSTLTPEQRLEALFDLTVESIKKYPKSAKMQARRTAKLIAQSYLTPDTKTEKRLENIIYDDIMKEVGI